MNKNIAMVQELHSDMYLNGQSVHGRMHILNKHRLKGMHLPLEVSNAIISRIQSGDCVNEILNDYLHDLIQEEEEHNSKYIYETSSCVSAVAVTCICCLCVLIVYVYAIYRGVW